MWYWYRATSFQSRFSGSALAILTPELDPWIPELSVETQTVAKNIHKLIYVLVQVFWFVNFWFEMKINK